MMNDDDAILAGELALGLLEGSDRAEALRRVMADPAFAREVRRWEERFAGMHAAWPEIAPPDTIGRRIVAPADVATPRQRGWQWAAGVAGVAAAVLLLLVLTRPPATPPPQPPLRASAPLVAVMTPTGGEAFGAVFDPVRREVRLAGGVAVPASRAAELWAIGGDGVPHAAGLIGVGPRAPIGIAPTIVVAPGTTLAISIEPAGGSPRSTPTGPVVASGKLAAT